MMAKLNTTSLTVTEFNTNYTTKNNKIGCPLYNSPPVTIYSITLLICVFGLVGNSIVLWFVGFTIKRSPFTIYILNLAVTDACFLLFSVTIIITDVMEYSFCVDTGVVKIFIIPSVLMYNNDVYLLTAISIERCLSVLCPIWYRCRRPRHLSIIVCAVLWVLSILLSGTVAFLCVILKSKDCFLHYQFMSIQNVAIFFPIMVLSNLTLFIKVQCSSQRRQPGKLYVIILLTVLFFLLFAFPMSVLYLLGQYIIYQFETIFHMLTCANSSVNPFIYFLVGSYSKQRFRGSVKGALQSVFEEKINHREAVENNKINSLVTAT